MCCSRITIFFFATALAIGVSGCSLSEFSKPSASSSTLPAVSGTIHGGQQPISGSTIQLYAANTAVPKGASTALLSNTVLTNANGAFNTGDYTCPAPEALVYIVATGGNPGLSVKVNNTGIALMTILGTCGSLTSSTHVSINELTTIAGIEALAPFMTDYAHVGVLPANLGGLGNAFANATAFVDPGTGQFRAATGGVTAPIALINTLADILASCINTGGGVAGDTTACGKLFRYATNGATADTIAAMLHIVQLPAQNVSLLFSLSSAVAPFVPALTIAPSSWAMASTISLDSNTNHIVDQVLTDSQGNVWLLQAVGNLITEYDNNLHLLHSFNLANIGYGSGAAQITVDKSDNLWALLGASLLEISSNGTVLSPPSGYPEANLPDSSFFPKTLTADSLGNIWVLATRVADYAVCLVEYSPSGALISPTSGYCGSVMAGAGNPLAMQAVADSFGNVYLFFSGNPGPVQKFTPSGVVTTITARTYPGGAGYAAKGGYGFAVFDPKYQRIWATQDPVYDNLKLDGTLVTSFNTFTLGSSLGSAGNDGLAVDGAGDLWVATLNGSLAEFSPAGSLLSPCSAYSCGIPISPANRISAGIAIDSAGSIFTVNASNATLLRFSGLAAPK